MRAAIAVVSVLFAVGLAAGFVFPPDTTAQSASPRTALAAPSSEQLYVGQGLGGRAAPVNTSSSTQVSTDIEVSLGDVIGVIALLGAGAVVGAIWVRSRNPVTRITHRHDPDEDWRSRWR